MPRDFDRLDLTATERCAILTKLLDLIDAETAIREIFVQAKTADAAIEARINAPYPRNWMADDMIGLLRERAISAARVALIGLRAQLAADPSYDLASDRIAEMEGILRRHAPDGALADSASVVAGRSGGGKGDLLRPMQRALAGVQAASCAG